MTNDTREFFIDNNWNQQEVRCENCNSKNMEFEETDEQKSIYFCNDCETITEV